MQEQLEKATIAIVQEHYGVTLPQVDITLTRKDQTGDLTVMVFPMLRHIKGNPVAIGTQIGEQLKATIDLVTDFNVVQGFLNIAIDTKAYIIALNEILADAHYGIKPVNASQPGVMVEYSSPNTNKPLHLGHVRNNLLGYSVAQIVAATGRKVNKTQVINDRGIHICKSMLAWEQENGHLPESEQDTPENRKKQGSKDWKGDKLVGDYYVQFEKQFQSEYSEWCKDGLGDELCSDFYKTNAAQNLLKELYPDFVLNGDVPYDKMFSLFKKEFKNDYFSNYSELGIAAKQMLLKWEQGDEEVVTLWKKMNQWVYDGFEVTYKNLGVDFDSLYYESNTYLLGKDVVQDGLDKEVFKKDPDGSVWIDLTEDGLDRKIVLRSDGTAVYMTQDIGTAIQRVKDFDINAMVYTVGNEQDYHFKVLFLILKKLGFDWADHLFHLSYGMVELPSGKMKSREGTVVDADELMEEMTATAKAIAQEQGKLDGLDATEKEELYNMIGLGALKYFMLKVDPKKSMLFNPAESVDFQGNTGPFIQYTHARIKSILKKTGFNASNLKAATNLDLTEKDLAVIKVLQQFPETIANAAKNYSPALVANYIYELVKEFNSFYQNVPKIVEEENESLKQFRLLLCYKTAAVIKTACGLLGIEVPEQM